MDYTSSNEKLTFVVKEIRYVSVEFSLADLVEELDEYTSKDYSYKEVKKLFKTLKNRRQAPLAGEAEVFGRDEPDVEPSLYHDLYDEHVLKYVCKLLDAKTAKTPKNTDGENKTE